jgi:U6 snRNA-associated Sm-like protein LSm8
MATTASMVEPYLNQTVIVTTHDGKVLVGKLIWSDPQCNLVVSNCKERIFSKHSGVEIQEHGLYLIRGDNVATVGDVEDEVDSTIDWNEIAAEPLKQIRY